MYIYLFIIKLEKIMIIQSTNSVYNVRKAFFHTYITGNCY